VPLVEWIAGLSLHLLVIGLSLHLVTAPPYKKQKLIRRVSSLSDADKQEIPYVVKFTI
jgi:hypothetical protein